MNPKLPYGLLALQFNGLSLPLEVLRSAAGFYIGTSADENPCTRESIEYWKTDTEAWGALKTHSWTQRKNP